MGKVLFAQLSNCRLAIFGQEGMEIITWGMMKISYNFVSSRERYCGVCVAVG